MENKFNSEKELYNKLKPALRTKKHELFVSGIKYIREINIWQYNKEFNWKEEKNLTLHKMVDDILNTDNSNYEKYVLDKLNSMKEEEIND